MRQILAFAPTKIDLFLLMGFAVLASSVLLRG
jgi:hypothetical protein